MKQLKIKREFWDKIVSGEKKYEFRKLSKGLETGIYEFREIKNLLPEGECADKGNHDGYTHFENGWGTPIKYCRKCNWDNDVYETFGTAKLRAASLRNQMNKDMSFWYEEGTDDNRIDKGTYDFIKENYIDKGIDFIAYEVTNVKVHNG